MASVASGLLDPELVHAPEGSRIRLLEAIPVFQIGHGHITRAGVAVVRQHGSVQLETEQSEAVLRKKSADRRQRQTVLLHVEQEIAAGAQAVEIRRVQDG